MTRRSVGEAPSRGGDPPRDWCRRGTRSRQIAGTRVSRNAEALASAPARRTVDAPAVGDEGVEAVPGDRICSSACRGAAAGPSVAAPLPSVVPPLMASTLCCAAVGVAVPSSRTAASNPEIRVGPSDKEMKDVSTFALRLPALPSGEQMAQTSRRLLALKSGTSIQVKRSCRPETTASCARMRSVRPSTRTTTRSLREARARMASS